MLCGIIKQICVNSMQRSIFQVRSYFTYFLITLWIIWYGIANYYYFIEQQNKCIGAFVTGSIFLILGFFMWLLNYCIKKKEAKRSKFNNIITDSLPVLSPVILKTFLNNIITKKPVKASILSILILTVIFYYFVNKKNHFINK